MYQSKTQTRVRYAETDQMNVVYYGNYAQYFEIGRVESMRALGFTYKNYGRRRCNYARG
jgi:acyl-CoA thioester hydrolase